ncbi:MAG: AraC family transcriptional regulator [Bacteroidota bacterium]|nr:AraC family transcriptional regulator [Bacteroidota bacterium]MDP4268926.1 AraC family transcriptional regulator [Bacteroidota bacterium]
MSKVQREVTPLDKEDLFILLDHKHAKFDYPLHFHSDYELNMVLNTSGKRIVGDTIEPFENEDLVLVGPGLPHAWKAPSNVDTHVITIQFQEAINSSFLLEKRVFAPIRELLERSKRGIFFSGKSFSNIRQKLLLLSQSRGFNTSLEFFSILNDLATAQEQRLIASPSYDSSLLMRDSRSRRIEKICKHIEDNFSREITLVEIAELVNMSESAVSHFFKKRTSRTFISYLTEVRIGYAARLLAETTQSISDICFQSGFENLSNFNRTFKKHKHQTPSEYRIDLQKIITKF